MGKVNLCAIKKLTGAFMIRAKRENLRIFEREKCFIEPSTHSVCDGLRLAYSLVPVFQES